MESYETISHRNSVTFPAVTINRPPCTPYSVAATTYSPPTGTTRFFEPYREERRIFDPSKGRRFAKLKNSGAIVMSPYENSLKITENSLSSRDKYRWYSRWLNACCNPGTGIYCNVNPLEIKTPTWTENDDFSSLSAKGLTVIGEYMSMFEAQVPDAIVSTQQHAYSEAMNAYDLLTEMGELRETVQYLSSKVDGTAGLMKKFADKDLPAYREGRRLNAKRLMRSSDAALRKLGRRWMEYRYALMPILYSFRDVSKLLELHGRYQSDRAKVVINCNAFPSLTGTEDNILYVHTEGQITVRSMTKAYFDSGDLHRLVSTLGLNPFRTAWELIPLSFVADWVLNVGDAITALSAIDYSTQRLGCTSVRQETTETVYHKEHWYGTNYRPAQTLPDRVLPAVEDRYDRTWETPVRKTVVNSYVRTLWTRPDPRLLVDPFINWKRFIDGLVLGYQPTKKILRSLK